MGTDFLLALGNPIGIAAAAVCFAVVLAATAWGSHLIVDAS